MADYDLDLLNVVKNVPRVNCFEKYSAKILVDLLDKFEWLEYSTHQLLVSITDYERPERK